MKATILLIVDDPGVRDPLGRALRSEGCDVTVASNGPEAIHALRATGFDLVLLDLDRPATQVWDTLSPIVTNSLSLPLVIITERPDQQHLAMQKGVAAVLEKPLDMKLLLGVMERALAERSEARGHGMRTESS
jgi:DNA-binding NtrC family response regulator